MPLITLHRTLPDRHAADAHDISDITGLQAAVDAALLQIPPADGWSGPALTGAPVGGGVTQHAAVYLDATGMWQLADFGSEEAGGGLVGIITTPVVGDTATIGLPAGIYRRTAWSWTPGAAVYLDVAGALTQSAPVSGVVRRVGYALTAQSIYLAPSVALTLA